MFKSGVTVGSIQVLLQGSGDWGSTLGPLGPLGFWAGAGGGGGGLLG